MSRQHLQPKVQMRSPRNAPGRQFIHQNVKKTFPLHKAIQYCNLRKIEILSKIHSLDDVNDDGYPAFVYACERENSDEILEFLFNLNFNPNLVNRDKFTALHILAFRGKLQWVKRLFEKFPDLDVDPLTEKENTPLIHAAKMDHHEIVKFLFKKGADINAKNNKYYTALLYAANNGYLKTTKVLIDLGAEINAKDNYLNTPLIKACGWGFEETVKMLLDNGAKVNEINEIGETALYKAIQRKHCDLVKLLLKKGAIVEYRVVNDIKKPVTTACFNNCVGILKVLVEHGGDINYPGNYSAPLIACVKGKSYDCAETLMNMRVKVNGKDTKGLNALAYARNDARMKCILQKNT